ncbi:hypothetical protein, conserved [Plasmodium gonderi]|uniref:RAP domain-containing protein n=1 Tax=Plasmodium gonderi TaxID=77519 RepID=A0A1Y1JLR2_PLAGO|nr:hypothetical protein, conserved [Plasmodium gonderi]GAW83506.1 hypothetical protein, conserved [Plasmodium gonderi]
MFVLKIGFTKFERRGSIRGGKEGIFFFNTINKTSTNFSNNFENENKKGQNEFHFSREKFLNFKNVNIHTLNNRELLYYLGYCSKNELLNIHILNSIMEELHGKVLNSVNCISNDFNQNKKNILNSKCYQDGNGNAIQKKPFFDIHDLVKVYLNICYINSYFFLKTKREKYKDSACILLPKRCSHNDVDKNDNMLIQKEKLVSAAKNVFTFQNEEEKLKEMQINESNRINIGRDIFKKDNKFIYTNSTNKNTQSCSEFICNEHVKNIFHLLSIFFLQNVNILNDHYLCRIFYGYNKSKFFNERYLNNLSFEIIKRIKKIRTYHLYLILMNSYYLNYIDKSFIKILLIHIINKLSQLPCEAICQVIPIVHLFIHSEKLIYKINIIYAKKIASFNQLNHLITLFKKMIQRKMISQKNIFLTFKHLNKFMKVKKSSCKKREKKERNVNSSDPSQIVHNGRMAQNDQVINNVVKNFESFKTKNRNSEKDSEVQKDEGANFPTKNSSNDGNKNTEECIASEVMQTRGSSNPLQKDTGVIISEKMFSYENELIRYSKNLTKENTEEVFRKGNLLFNMKVIEMHLRHDFKNIYFLFPNDYKNFLQKVRNIPYNANKNMQGEKEIYILKKYMNILNYKFITFTYGPYVLHICDPFYKIYLEWENGWKLFPMYQQNMEKNFRENKMNHLRKEGFSEILICHDTFTNCQHEEEKLKYLISVLKDSKFTKCNNITGATVDISHPLESQDLYI